MINSLRQVHTSRSFLRKALIFVCLVSLAQGSWAFFPTEDGEGRALPSLAPMLKTVNPAVVNISTYTTRTIRQNPLLNDPFFRRFFNVPEQQLQQPQQRRTQSAGSGVIIDAKKGIVLTNHHVIDGANEITVGMEDGRNYTATLIGSDPDVDIAVLEIEADELTAVKLADSEHLEVGDYVVAIGNPFGLGQTVTTGIVSALGRTGLGIEGYENFIQTDASINPGNSGGALVNLRGELVGVNTAILAPSGGNVGIGFAIPINMAKVSIDQIIEHGEVRRGQLGVVIQDLTPELGDAFDLEKHQRGAVIAEVQPGSAAEKAGLKVGDVVIDVDGKDIQSSAQLRNAVGLKRVGDRISVTVLREGKRKTFKARLAVASDGKSLMASNDIASDILKGVTLRDAEERQGVLVTNVERSAEAAGKLLRGDLIVSVNQRRVADIEQFSEVLKVSKGRLLLRVLRGQMALWVVLEP
ncbi:Periplasmic serine endoprotease DegP [Zhongshania aliphaticivorans]|uniref:Periplasmic serine endoprotease DegP n=1 Tax=Zhongshania aliphaticivorans TaxID=1470434 RepID=A0A5S9ND25_9GAMM|nr:DegQ family serine endoprotease [Zhongshania aliphaticivorans]CAA0088166.1 Periplasmic serine endoprotease DegP [Zhongshania aliphaticivorans]CAA0116087.1 Periplasmic serine endoprotease DegP [Zhongshania aliphaticivorans]CAA0120368.1 Periplasmic serine endoprotease DegP [Zhongshania aliphaticivorans]